MEWDDLKYFLELARTGTLTAAARRLQVQHSTVSRRITRLERMQGTPLFTRSLEGYHLNRAGQKLLTQAEEIEAAFARIGAGRDVPADPLSGLVRIGCTEGFASCLIGPWLTAFRQAHPGITIDLLVKPRSAHLPRNEADIVINIDRPERGPYLISKLLDYRLGLFAAEPYLSSRTAPQRLADLKDHQFISYVAEMEPAKDLPTCESVPNTTRPVIRSTSLSAQKVAVLSGCGIALLPNYVGDNEPLLRAVLPDLVNFRKTYYMLMPEEARKVPRISTVWKSLKETFRNRLTDG